MIDRDSKEVRHWARSEGQLAEIGLVDPWASVQCLPVRFQGVDGVLVVETLSGVTRI